MKVLHVTRQFYPTTGGIPNAVWHLSKYLMSRGIQSNVLALNRLFQEDRSTLKSFETIDGIEISRIPYFGSRRYAIAPEVLNHIHRYDLIHRKVL